MGQLDWHDVVETLCDWRCYADINDYIEWLGHVSILPFLLRYFACVARHFTGKKLGGDSRPCVFFFCFRFVASLYS
jgi:hypothetical protein